MKKEKTKFFTLILTALLLTSCGSTAQTPDVTGTTDGGSDTVSSAPDETDSPLPERDYGGYEFRMFIRGDDAFIPDMWAEDLDGETMNDAIFERNRRVSETYGVNFRMFSVSGDDEGKEAMNTIMAGDDSYDILVCHARRLSQYSHNDLLLEWNENLPYIDLDGEWWNQDARDNLSIAGKLYTCAGDISYMNLGAADCMFYNKRILADIGAADIYDTVRDGGWTLDVFSELVKKGATDLNGDAKISEEDDRLGYVTTEWIGPIQVLYSGGQRIWKKDDAGKVYLSLNTERTVDIFDKFFKMTDSDSAYIIPDWRSERLVEFFTTGRSLFVDMNVKNVALFRGMNDDFGILPWPKFDAAEEKYRANVDAGCNMVAVPVTNPDPERTSIIIEALCRDGSKNVMPLYYETVLQSKYTRDDDSVQMLDIIRDGRVFDLGYYYWDVMSLFNSTGRDLSLDADHNFPRYYAEKESMAKAKIDEVNEHFFEGR